MMMMLQVLVLGPDTVSTDDTLGNDTRAKMVVGAVNIALHNTGTTLPCLVQVSHDDNDSDDHTDDNDSGDGLQEAAL